MNESKETCAPENVVLTDAERWKSIPRSYIRTPYRLALRLAYHFRRSGEIRTYHVPCK
mgnify:CR=1 FL=1